MALVFVLALLASSHPTPDGEDMRLPGFRVNSAPELDSLAGAPAGSMGSTEFNFPEGLTFGQPCEDMETEPFVPTDPVPTPTPQQYPEEGHTAWDIARVAANIFQINGCNVTRSASFDFAVAVWRALPASTQQLNTCPDFLRRNPLFPETPAPTPAPIDLLRDEERRIRELEKAREHADLQGDDATKLMIEKQLSDIKTGALDRATDVAEQELEPTPVMAPLPIVPEDCGEDLAGSVGLVNDEVSGTGKGMNRGFHPLPAVYNPRGNHESLETRERLIGAKSTSHDSMLLNMMQTNEGLTSNECTIYNAMSLASTAEPSSKQHADLRAECEEACLFDDDCTAWVWVLPTSQKADNCRLFSEESPKLVDKQGEVVGLCPKSKQCPKSTLNRILDVTHSPAARRLNCPALLAAVMDGQKIQKADACPCIGHLKMVWAAPATGDNCVLSPESIPWRDVLALCNNANLVQVNMIQHHLHDCSGTSLFSAGVGGCATYAADHEHSNFLHCATDFDSKIQKFAKDACSECGSCQATPSPTPYIPPPALASSVTLPNGETTPCLDAMKAAAEDSGKGPLGGSYAPQCFMDGSFMPTQCSQGTCWCVYESGVEIAGTRFDENSENRTKCRDPPAMGLVYPAFPEVLADPQLVAARSLAKLLYQFANPELICRPGDNRTLESVILSTLRTRSATHNRTKPTCPFTSKANSLPFSEYLSMIAQYLVPPPVRRHSPSPSNSPTPSASPSISVSPSASPSAPVAMCGDVMCSEMGVSVHMYKRVPQGFCHLCLEGSSGPCRDSRTLACHDFLFGDVCHHTHVKCSNEQLDIQGAKPLCKDREGDHAELIAFVTVPMHNPTAVGVEWHPTISSAVSDILGVSNLCDIAIHIVEGPRNSVSLTVNVARKESDQSFNDLANLSDAVASGSLLNAFSRRGFPVDTGRSIVMETAHVASE